MKRFFVALMTMVLILSSSIPVLAHALFLTLEEPGVLKAEYDGGGFSPRMEIIVFDKNDNELARGNVDDEGKFHFDKNLPAHYATVSDGMGHNARWEEGVVEKEIPKLPIIIGVFIVIGGIFYYYSKKKKK